MTDQSGSKTPQAPAGGVPQAIADELAVLASEVRRMEQKASRGWKTTAIGFAILLAVIATYIGLLIYKPLTQTLTEESLVQIVFDRVDGVLNSYGAPNLQSAQLPDWAGQKLAGYAPELMQQTVKPQIEDAIKKLPEWRAQIVKEVKDRGPEVLDQAIAQAQSQLLPMVRQRLVETAMDQANTALDGVEDQLETVIGGVIEANVKNMKDLNPESVDTLRRAMEISLEEQLAPVLDPMFEGISAGVDSTQSGLSDLVAKYDSGTLSHEEKLEVALVQLTYALFELKAVTPEEGGQGLWEQLQTMLQQGTEGLNMPAAPQPSAGGAVPAVPTVSPAQMLQDKIKGMEEALKRTDLPDAARQSIQKQLDDAKKQLEAMPAAPAAAPAPARTAPPVAVPARTVSPAEQLQMKISSMEEALKAPTLSEQARNGIQAQLDQAKKELEALKAQ
jgi:hypothetical protein